MIIYHTPSSVVAFTTGRDEKPTNEAENTALIPQPGAGMAAKACPLALPRQTHTAHVEYAHAPERHPDTDAVWTDRKGLALAVKTADCIPVLLYDAEAGLIAAIHAGWKGTVQYIVRNTIAAMYRTPNPVRRPQLHAIIGPGISLTSFEVGDEVYEKFAQAGFPMQRIARQYPHASDTKTLKWHIDLYEANRWVLEECGVMREHIHIDGTDTLSTETLYSARRESINTGRNYNLVMMV